MPKHNHYTVQLTARAAKEIAEQKKNTQEKIKRFLWILGSAGLEDKKECVLGFKDMYVFRYGGDLRVLVQKTSVGYSIIKIAVKKR